MYYLVYGFLYTLSLLPMWVLYRFSDGIAFLLNHVFKYRYDVVLSNLRIAFPEKTDAERLAIARAFYKNFVDNFIETIKLLSASETFIKKRFQIDEDIFTPIEEKGEKLQVHLGHNFNWEIANLAMPLYIKMPFLAVYMPIKSKVMDRLFLKLRTRTGSHMLPANNMRKAILPFRSGNYLLTLVADQVPGNIRKAYWANFFGKPAPFVTGPESGARAEDMNVAFARIYKVKRGYYRAQFTLLPKTSTLPHGEVTRRYVRFLEQTLRENPTMWLWSHRRWKHEWKAEYADQWIDDQPTNSAYSFPAEV